MFSTAALWRAPSRVSASPIAFSSCCLRSSLLVGVLEHVLEIGFANLAFKTSLLLYRVATAIVGGCGALDRMVRGPARPFHRQPANHPRHARPVLSANLDSKKKAAPASRDREVGTCIYAGN